VNERGRQLGSRAVTFERLAHYFVGQPSGLLSIEQYGPRPPALRSVDDHLQKAKRLALSGGPANPSQGVISGLACIGLRVGTMVSVGRESRMEVTDEFANPIYVIHQRREQIRRPHHWSRSPARQAGTVAGPLSGAAIFSKFTPAPKRSCCCPNDRPDSLRG
jgi:hypothetical protein